MSVRHFLFLIHTSHLITILCKLKHISTLPHLNFTTPSNSAMSCPILSKWRNSPLGTHSENYLQLVDFTPELETRLWARLPDTPGKDFQIKLGEQLYYCVGSALAVKGDWDKMTFLQLEHEARVLGLLGPNQEHCYTPWRLKIMLACEEKEHEIWVDSEAKGSRQHVKAAC